MDFLVGRLAFFPNIFFLIVKDPYWDANRNTKMQTAKSMDTSVGRMEIFWTKFFNLTIVNNITT